VVVVLRVEVLRLTIPDWFIPAVPPMIGWIQESGELELELDYNFRPASPLGALGRAQDDGKHSYTTIYPIYMPHWERP
jgi:hypothetical protein